LTAQLVPRINRVVDLALLVRVRAPFRLLLNDAWLRLLSGAALREGRRGVVRNHQNGYSESSAYGGRTGTAVETGVRSRSGASSHAGQKSARPRLCRYSWPQA